MRHYKKGRKLGTDASHTKAIKKNLCVALFTNDRIKTTLERAKEIRGDVDRIITWAKRGDVHSRRLAIAKLGDKHLVAEIFSKVEQGLFKDREGGYTRIMKLGTRRGDAAVIVIMELVQEPVRKKKKADSAEKSDAPKKAAAATSAKAKKDKKADEADDIIDIEPLDDDDDFEDDDIDEDDFIDEVADDEEAAEEDEPESEVEVEAEAETEAETEAEAEAEVQAEPEAEAEAEAEVEAETEAEEKAESEE